MKVKEVMTELVRTCGADSNLAAAAMSMWDGDCGIIPVVDRSREQVIGLITDRDICIAAAMKGRPLSEDSSRRSNLREGLFALPTMKWSRRSRQ